MIWIVPSRQIILINQTAFDSLKLLFRGKMDNNKLGPNNGMPSLNYSNFYRASCNFLRRSFSEGNFYFQNWWQHPQQLEENKHRKSATFSSNDHLSSEDFPGNPYKWVRGRKSQYEDHKRAVDDASRRYIPLRDWIDVPKTSEKNAAFKKSFNFIVMTFNVLAQDLLQQHPYLYSKHNPEALKWQVRWKRIHKEISSHKPDIVCLQEVQESHLGEYFLKQLESLGYSGIYKKRTGLTCDGCAIFYKFDKVSLLDHTTVEFMQPNVPLLNRDNVAIVAVFCPKDLPDNKFIVVTTHLLYNPKRQDVRLAQVQVLLAEIERLSFYLDSKKQKNYLPIILNGDFNATPSSSLYEFICKGFLKYEHLAARKLDEEGEPCQGPILIPADLQITDSCQHALLVKIRDEYYEKYHSNCEDHHEECMMNLSKKVDLNKLHHSAKKGRNLNCSPVRTKELFSSGTLSHQFAFKSVYSYDDQANPQATTFQNEWVTVDYIFYSGKKNDGQFAVDNLKLSGYFRLPYRSELEGFRMPNESLGSDHFSLVAKFLLNTGS